MTENGTVKLTGQMLLNRVMRDFPKDMAKEISRKVIRKALKPMLDETIRRAPHGDTGEYIKTIKIKTVRKKKDPARIELKVDSKGVKLAGGGKGKGAFNPHWLEFGRKKKGNTRAQPHFRPAFHKHSPTTPTLLQSLILPVMKQVAARHAKKANGKGP